MISKNRKRRKLRRKVLSIKNSYNRRMRMLNKEDRITTLDAAVQQECNANFLPKEKRISFGPDAKIITTKTKNPSQPHPFRKMPNERKHLKKIKRRMQT